MPQNIHVANRTIGLNAPCFIAAEIGINHNGDMDLAERMIRVAAESGANAVKFQNYRTGDFVSDRSLMLEYRSRGEMVTESQHDLFKRCELDRDDIIRLARCCDDNNVIFFSTPTGQESLDDLLALGVPLLKNGSDYLGHLSLVRAMARSGVPTVLSTGMATLAEMDDAVRAFREAGGNDLILLHCTSSYPTPDDQVNLRKIPAMQSAFGCLTGFSDHTAGTVAAMGAVTLGACMVEKHFTLDRNLPGPDHWFSATPDELRDLVRGVRTLEASLGNSILGPTECESSSRTLFRLSCTARVALPAGHLVRAGDVAFQRPGTGLPPAALDWILNARLKSPVAAGHIFTREDFS